MKFKAIGALITLLLIVVFAVFSFNYKNTLINPDYIKDNSFYNFFFELNAQIYDSFFYKKQKQPSSDKAFLIAIDEDSVREIGRWPWSREVITQITENSIKYGVKSIGNDIIYSESENEKSDQQFTQLVSTHPEKVILGTFSDNRISFNATPFSDFCYNEAFLFNGGEHIVKLKVDLAIDDDNTLFEQLQFKDAFAPIFNHIQQSTEKAYEEKYKKSILELSQYQKNRLADDKITNVFDYCTRWFTKDDEYYTQSKDIFQLAFEPILKQIPQLQNLPFDKQISKFKKLPHKILIPQYSKWVSNISSLQEASLYTASFVADMDSDGVIRKYPLLFRIGNKPATSYIPSLALQTYLAATGYQAYFKFSTVNNEKTVAAVQIKDVNGEIEKLISDLPIDKNGRLIINYYGKNQSIPYVSARDLLDESSDTLLVKSRANGIQKIKKSDFLKDKAAIFGATATAIGDIRNTPVEPVLPGPETHLTILANLFSQEFMKIQTHEYRYVLIFYIIVMLVLLYLFVFHGLLYSTFFTAVILYSLYLITENHFNKNIQFDLLSFVIIFVGSAYVILLAYVYFFETRKSQEIKNTFSKYVSKEIVDEILKNQDNLKLQGQKLNMTVFFSDIRSFTNFSEKMDPQELSTMLNQYFTPMSERIFGNNGTVDKFIGDAIMALFGAPINYPDHPQKACRAALQCLAHIDILNKDFVKKGWPEISIGIGLNTGIMVAGNIGSAQIQSYTVIGDEVNLGSRLEGLTKNYHSKCLISESTYEAVKNEFVAREADIVRVKGKQKPVRIYDLIAEKVSAEEQLFIDKYHEALKIYQNKNFPLALELFNQLILQKPDDFLCSLYQDRAKQYCENSPDENWDGVFEYKTK